MPTTPSMPRARSIARLPFEIRALILGQIQYFDLPAVLLSGRALYDVFQADQRRILNEIIRNSVRPEALHAALACVMAERCRKDSRILTHLRNEAGLEREARAEAEWWTFGGLTRIETPEACPKTDTGLAILQDFWCLVRCPETGPLSLDELQALLALHATTERLIADLVSRASSSHLPEALHARPVLLPMETTRHVMAQLSPVEKARLHRAFYREEFLNRFFAPQEDKLGGIDQVNLVKAWCMSVTWPPWETQEIMTAHAYIKHQLELVHEAINADFIQRLESQMLPQDRTAGRLEAKSDAHASVEEHGWREPEPDYEGFLVVEPRANAIIAVDSYIERSVGLGIGHLRHVLSQDDKGRRRLAQRHFHALSDSNHLSYHGPALHWSLNSVTRFQRQLRIAPEASSGKAADQPGPGWTRFMRASLPNLEIVPERHYLHLAGLVFWDAGRLDAIHAAAGKDTGHWAAEEHGFHGPPNMSGIWPRSRGWWLYMDEEAKRPRGAACWFFTTPPPRALLIDPHGSLQDLGNEFRYDRGNWRVGM